MNVYILFDESTLPIRVFTDANIVRTWGNRGLKSPRLFMSTSFRRFRSLPIAQNVLTSNPFGGIGGICVSKNLGRCTQTSLPLITHRSPLITSQNSQCGGPIKSPHCIRSHTALFLPTHRIAFFRSLYKNGALPYWLRWCAIQMSLCNTFYFTLPW